MKGDSPDRTRAVGASVLIVVAAALAFLYFRGAAIDAIEEDAAVDEIAARETVGEGRGRGARGSGLGSRDRSASRAVPSPPIRLSPAEATTDPSAQYGVLAGRVVSWSTGAPIPGAELTFALRGRSGSITTDGSGLFTYHANAEGDHTLSLVIADGFHPYAPEWDTSPLSFRARADQRIQGIIVYLVPAVAYAGIVEDADGEPVAGAEVRLIDRGDAERVLVPLAETEWSTAADGTFAFQAPDGAILEARHPDLGRGRGRVDFSAEASRSLTITLSADAAPAQIGTRISGVVQLADGTPLPGVAVFANPQPDNPAAPAEQLHPSGQSTTDGEGRFTIEGLDVGPHLLFARARSHAAARVSAPAPGTDVLLILRREVLIEGTVTDAETGAPLAASTVVVERALGPLSRRVVATATTFGSDGRYVVRGIAAGSYEVSATAYGYAPSEPRPVLVDGEHPTEVALSLSRGATIRGVVVSGEAGPPVANARVTLEGRLGGQSSAVPILASAATDADGRFTLTGVPPGSRSLFIAAEGHHGRVLSGLLATEASALELTVDLTPTEEGEEPRIELVGIGAVLGLSDDGLIVGRVVDGGGAAEVGLAPDDIIVAVDGVPVTELGFSGAIDRIRGPEGSTLVISVRRAGAEREEDLIVTRKRIRA